MMIEEQVTSLELSKRLEEIGIKQDSLFVWEYYDDSCYAVKFIPYALFPDKFNKYKLYSAFTSSELAAMLPKMVSITGEGPFNNFRIKIIFFTIVEYDTPEKAYSINYICDTYDFNEFFNERKLLQHNIYDTNFANALAKCLIYLIENDLLPKRKEDEKK